MASSPPPMTAPQPRCLTCRVEVMVPASYAHGDQVKCGSCGTLHKVVRGERVRLVLADVAGLREQVRTAEERLANLEGELREARGSMGVGVNGLAVGLIYLLWQIGFNEANWSASLLWRAAGLSLLAAVLLEAANYFFLAKRQRMTRLSEEVASARSDLRQSQQRLRESTRV